MCCCLLSVGVPQEDVRVEVDDESGAVRISAETSKEEKDESGACGLCLAFAASPSELCR